MWLLATVLNRHRTCPASQKALQDSADAGQPTSIESAGYGYKSGQNAEYAADEKDDWAK